MSQPQQSQLVQDCLSSSGKSRAMLLWQQVQGSMTLAALVSSTATIWLAGLTATVATAAPALDPEIKVGIVQRFGDEPQEQLELQATPGDRLMLKFKSAEQPQAIEADKVKLEVVMQPLTPTAVEERVVLSNHRSFETAEAAAKQWQAAGIEVEIAQPEYWQVWAKREIYSTPLLRRFLLRSIQLRGNKIAYLDTQVRQQVPQVNWVVNGSRYSANRLEVTTGNNQVVVNQGKNPADSYLYAGSLQLQPNAYGTYTLVNQVPLEEYLRGVVPYEIGKDAPYTAIEAQAIIARTYALRNLRRFAIDGYQLCADTQCQVYRGISGAKPGTDRAIAATRGEVLTYRQQLVDALYSSTTGGVTAAFSDVWDGTDRPYLHPVVDAAGSIWSLSRQSLANEQNFQQFISLRQGFNETGQRLFRWRRESSLADLAKDLQRYLQANNSPMAKFKTLTQLQVVERSPSGRILKLVAQTDLGVITLEKDEVRSAFSAPRSTLFYLQPLSKEQQPLWGYAFVGGGLGHGVGLSQTGSYGLANLGWSSDRILSFYYPGTQIQPLSSLSAKPVATTPSLLLGIFPFWSQATEVIFGSAGVTADTTANLNWARQFDLRM